MHECRYCGAVFWFQERVKSASNLAKRKIVYNLCCRGGKINLKPYKKPPTPLADLLKFDGDARSKRFLKQIRSYNSLFAFTFMLQFVIYIFLSSYMLSICLPTETLLLLLVDWLICPGIYYVFSSKVSLLSYLIPIAAIKFYMLSLLICILTAWINFMYLQMGEVLIVITAYSN